MIVIVTRVNMLQGIEHEDEPMITIMMIVIGNLKTKTNVFPSVSILFHQLSIGTAMMTKKMSKMMIMMITMMIYLD